MTWRRHKFGLLAMLLGIYALGLAAVPMVIFDEPPKWFGDHRGRDGTPPNPATTRPGGVTVSTKRFSFSFRKNKKAEPEPTLTVSAPPATASPSRPFKIGSVFVALIGLAVAALGSARERGKALPAYAAAFCVAAIAFEYVLVALAVGVAITVILLILGNVS